MTTAGKSRRLALELRLDAEPIQGRLYDLHEGDGRLDRPFSGWLGLIAAVDAARAREQGAEARTEGRAQ